MSRCRRRVSRCASFNRDRYILTLQGGRENFRDLDDHHHSILLWLVEFSAPSVICSDGTASEYPSSNTTDGVSPPFVIGSIPSPPYLLRWPRTVERDRIVSIKISLEAASALRSTCFREGQCSQALNASCVSSGGIMGGHSWISRCYPFSFLSFLPFFLQLW